MEDEQQEDRTIKHISPRRHGNSELERNGMGLAIQGRGKKRTWLKRKDLKIVLDIFQREPGEDVVGRAEKYPNL